MATPQSELPSGTVTFLFTDIEGSTDLARQLGADFGRVRSEHRRVLRDAFERHEGHEIDTAGDGFFIVFERAGDAVRAAIAAQRALFESQRGQALAVRVRMGLHSAEPYLDDEGYVGVGVHRAARICAAGHGGQILLSNATAGIVEDLGVEGVRLQDLGEHRLKDMERPQRLFQLDVADLPAEFPALKSLDAVGTQPSIVTLVISDLVGWYRAIETFGDERAAAIARRYHDVVLGAVKAHNGRELEVAADQVIAGFARPRDAVHAARSIRELLRSEPWFPDDDRPAVKIAIHSGEIADPTARHLGTLGFRLISLSELAAPWQILVSYATEALLAGGPADIELRHVGERTLPRLDHPVHVFELES